MPICGELSVRATEDTLRFKVQDTGMGMTPATKLQLFQKFSRGRGTEKLPIHGTGLGTLYCQICG
ncbi:MAG: HAMP domain-containing histidine kinase [Deltaproteobacteria bacterium]|nr:HAMP domain-containing histidine kinase [Deltaproteobacteria bacterium]